MKIKRDQWEERREFSLDDYILNRNKGKEEGQKKNSFKEICQIVKEAFAKEWDKTEDNLKQSKLEREKDAIIGKKAAVEYYKTKIKEILKAKNLASSTFPKYYKDLVEGVFHENWGLSGLAPWAYDYSEKYKKSSSAKIIGNKMYCMIDGKVKLQPQRISDERRNQLKKALLLSTPKERLSEGFHEVYLHNGIRITIYSGDRTKEGQDIMVFRKYTHKTYNFESIAELGTFPKEAIPLFETMVKVGFNVLFSGQVRSGKTTFLQTWQSYEDPTLEGLAIATDPETQWNKIMPKAPIMQIVADGKELEKLTKSLLRGDNDYILLEEMRDETAFQLGLEITSTGTKRSKATIHSNDPYNIPYKMGSKIHAKYGGNLNSIIGSVFQNFDYIFQFGQEAEDRSKKVLKSIWELNYNGKKDVCSMNQLCNYDQEKKEWAWSKHISKELRETFSDQQANLQHMEKCLEDLHDLNKMEVNIVNPAYYKTIS